MDTEDTVGDSTFLWKSGEYLCMDGSFKGYDVELGGVTGVLDGAGTVPLPRTILFGINVGF